MSAVSSIPDLGAFGSKPGFDRPALSPLRGVRPTRPAGPADAPPERQRPAAPSGPVRATAYQRNVDGDDASLSSRLSDLSPEEREQVEKLRARDREVRAHEEAHRAAAGPLFRGGPSYDYQTGPDGRRYAVGGSVQLDTSPGDTPEETIRKAQQIKRAALAPAEPSGKDRAVAAKAARMESEAKAELAGRQVNSSGDEDSTQTSGAPAVLADRSPPEDARRASTDDPQPGLAIDLLA